MAITQLDPRTAFIAIDLQKGIAAMPAVPPVAQIAQQARRLGDGFRRYGLPVVWVNVDAGAPGRVEQVRNLVDRPDDWAELLAELNRQPEDHQVTKRTWGAFTGTDLHVHLQSLGVTQVVLCGVATSAGVESTARHAHELGYHVTLAVDAMADMSPEAHANSITRIFPRIGETATVQAILDLLDTRHP